MVIKAPNLVHQTLVSRTVLTQLAEGALAVRRGASRVNVSQSGGIGGNHALFFDGFRVLTVYSTEPGYFFVWHVVTISLRGRYVPFI